MIIRTAFRDDVDVLLMLEQSCDTAAHWSRTEYERIFGDGGVHRLVMVAERDERVVGFAVARNGGSEWELENLVVERDLRRKGIGSALLWTLVEHARCENMQRMFLEVRESNVAALQLYKSAGFQERGRRKQYYSNPPEDALVLECRASGATRESR